MVQVPTPPLKGAKALGLFTAWIAPHATDLHADVDIHLKALADSACCTLFTISSSATLCCSASNSRAFWIATPMS